MSTNQTLAKFKTEWMRATQLHMAQKSAALRKSSMTNPSDLIASFAPSASAIGRLINQTLHGDEKTATPDLGITDQLIAENGIYSPEIKERITANIDHLIAHYGQNKVNTGPHNLRALQTVYDAKYADYTPGNQ